MTRHWLFLSLLLITACARGAEPPRATPESVGLSAARLAALDEHVGRQVRDGQVAGAVVLVARQGKIVHLKATGFADVETRKPMTTDAIFRWYSMTKPITATALMMLYEEGRFDLRQPLEQYIPEFKGLKVLRKPDAALTDTVEMQKKPTIQDSLRHTAGFTHGIDGSPLDQAFVDAKYFALDTTLKGMVTRAAALPLKHQPGKKWEYSIGPDIDARLVEILSGKSFDVFLQQRLFAPLGMRDTAFWLDAGKAPRLATLHWMKDGKLTPLDRKHGAPGWFVAAPELVNSYTTNHPRKGGSYGLVGTAEDYWRYAQMMLDGGTLDGVRILSPRTVDYMLSDHLAPANIAPFDDGQGFGLGFGVLLEPAAAGYIASPGSVYWSGAGATSFWIDRKQSLIIIVMTQHMDAPAAGSLGEEVRQRVYAAMLN